MSDLQDDFAFCQSELKRLDPVRHFASLTVAEARRADFLAFQCFLADLAAIPMRVSEPAMGEIRLTWWQDIVKNAGADQGEESEARSIGPLASCLKRIQHRYGLSEGHLLPIIEARRFDLYNDPMPDMAHFETYAGEVEALALKASTHILGADAKLDLSDLCGHAGMAICLAQHVFDWPSNAEKQRVFLPTDAFDGPAIVALCEVAERHCAEAMAELTKLPRDMRGQLAPAFLRLGPARLMIQKRKKQPLGLLRLANWRCYWSIWRLAAAL